MVGAEDEQKGWEDGKEGWIRGGGLMDRMGKGGWE